MIVILNLFFSERRTIISMLMLFIAITVSAHSLAASQAKPDQEMRDLIKQTISEAGSFEDRFDAEVWFVTMSGRLSRFIENPKERLRLLRLVHREANRVGVQPELVLAIIEVESAFDPYALSHVGAQGLMQVMPFWRNEIGKPNDNLMKIETNLRYGNTILSAYLKREKGNLTRALARYNGSLGKTWYPERVFKAWQKNWFYQHQN